MTITIAVGLSRVVGIGPGHEAEMTEKAINAIQESDMVAGVQYIYCPLLKTGLPTKKL